MAKSNEKQGIYPFEFDLAKALFNQIRRAMDRTKPLGFANLENLSVIPSRPGVYMLLRNVNPVYIGKADRKLATRLRKHRRTISGCSNIGLEEMFFKAVCFAKTWDPFKPEDHLKRYYGTNQGEGWNDRGFGTNEPGGNRFQTKYDDNHYYKRFPINTQWPCAIETGEYQAFELLQTLKKQVPFWFRFQGNIIPKKNSDLATAAQGVLKAKKIRVPKNNMTAEELLVLVARNLPGNWQATIIPSHMLLFMEKNKIYPDMRVVWPV